MVDRRSSINYINEKYHGRRSVNFAAPSVVYNQLPAPTVVVPPQANTVVVEQEHHAVDVPVSQPAPIHDNRMHAKGFRICGCPWWLCLLLALLGLLLLGLLIGFLTGVFGDRKENGAPADPNALPPTTDEQGGQQPQGEQPPQGEVNGGTPEQGCNPGFFPHNGKCISCPEGSHWNGENCVKNTHHLSSRKSF